MHSSKLNWTLTLASETTGCVSISTLTYSLYIHLEITSSAVELTISAITAIKKNKSITRKRRNMIK